jgi:hypothetical protein
MVVVGGHRRRSPEQSSLTASNGAIVSFNLAFWPMISAAFKLSECHAHERERLQFLERKCSQVGSFVTTGADLSGQLRNRSTNVQLVQQSPKE